MPAQLVILALSRGPESALARATLEGAGFLVEVADGPLMLLERAASGAVAIVLDGRLADGAAFRIGEALEAAASTRRVPLLWLGGPEQERAARAAGATAFLQVPLDPEELTAHVTCLAEGSLGREQLQAGLARLREGSFPRAFEDLRAVAEAQPGSLLSSWGAYHAGQAREREGDLQGAAEELHALLDERPDFWRAHLRLGELYERAGFDFEATEHFRQAHALEPRLEHLAAMAELLDRLRGDTEAESPEADRGPAAEPEARAAAGPDARADAGAGTATGAEAPGEPVSRDSGAAAPMVLLADDSQLARAMIGESLAEAGYRVVMAKDGKEALELATAERPDLLVLDGLMPGATGFEVCRRIKEQVYPDDPPAVLILSAIYTKQRQRTEAMAEYGADDVIAKSTDNAALLRAVRQRVAARGSAGH